MLVRDEDPTGVSGIGVVVWGIEFPDGVAAYRWATQWRTTCVAATVEELMRIHGHGGTTRLVWLDDEEAGQVWQGADGGFAA